MAIRRCATTGKTRYKTEVDAKIGMANVQLKAKKERRKRNREEPVRVYDCEFCHGWHMTSQEKR